MTGDRRSSLDRAVVVTPYRFGPSRPLASGPRLAGGLTVPFPTRYGRDGLRPGGSAWVWFRSGPMHFFLKKISL
jgi:hypothetical protein